MTQVLIIIFALLSFGTVMILGLFWNAGENYIAHDVNIQCPECGKIQKARVLEGFPWDIYVHHCSYCEYIITESEWEEVA